VGAELQQCGMCQLVKRTGHSTDDGTVFICDQCNQFAVDLHKMQVDNCGEDQSSDS
jgi:hypothetical protein